MHKLAAQRLAKRLLLQALKWLEQGLNERAELLFKRILRLDPQAFQAAYQLGLLAEKKSQFALAARYYKQVIVHNRRYAPPYLKLGQLYEGLNDFYPAFIAYGEFLLRTPKEQRGQAYLHFARMLSLLEQDETALSFYLQALEQLPAETSIYFLLAETYQNMGDMDAALDCFMALGKLETASLPLVSFFMGYLLEKNNEYESALKCYDQALSSPNHLTVWRLKRELAYPLIMESREQIEHFEQRLLAALKTFRVWLLKKPLTHQERVTAYLDILQYNIVNIAYHHYNPLPLRREFADLLPDLLPINPSVRYKPRAQSGRFIHVGYICAPKSINLAFAAIGGLFNQLDPTRFRISVFCNSPKIRQVFNPQNKYCFDHPNATYKVLSSNYIEAAKQIQHEELDLLLFTEPNWDAFQYSLASLRLARAQATSWMNPGTSGMPEMDYFFSSELIERKGAESDYSETLVQFKSLPSYMPAYEIPENPVSRSDYGLEEVKHLYACPQNLLKIHPDFDTVISEILRRDPDGHIVLLANKKQARICDFLLKRFQRNLPDVMERIWILPEMPLADFLGLLTISDVLLDPFYYGGGITTYQAIACEVPVITWPAERMVGRITAGFYKKMGVLATIADSPEDYIQKSLKFAMNPDLRADLLAQIRAQNVFDDRTILTEFSNFMENIVSDKRVTD
jgi:protein O-GlcNAc transferase